RFHPQAEEVGRWKLTVADARGEEVTSFQGHGNPPGEIAWDGRSKEGRPVTPGLTYSYVFEAFDKAGNKRRFVGPGFRVSAYRTAGAEGPVMLFSGAELSGSDGDHDLSSDAGADPDDARGIGLSQVLIVCPGARSGPNKSLGTLTTLCSRFLATGSRSRCAPRCASGAPRPAAGAQPRTARRQRRREEGAPREEGKELEHE